MAHLQVVLMEDLPNVGKSGELCRVKPGFARNFLIPRGLAAMATKDNVRRIEHDKRVAQARAAKQRVDAQALAAKLATVSLTIAAKVGAGQAGEGPEGAPLAGAKLYGSVTSRDVGDALAEQGYDIDRRKIVMEPIKELGSFKVPIKIASGVDAEVTVEVVPR